MEELLEEVLADRPFYEQSGGGVTFSGGEPLSQPGFTAAFLHACKTAGLRTALDTPARLPGARSQPFYLISTWYCMTSSISTGKPPDLDGIDNVRILAISSGSAARAFR